MRRNILKALMVGSLVLSFVAAGGMAQKFGEVTEMALICEGAAFDGLRYHALEGSEITIAADLPVDATRFAIAAAPAHDDLLLDFAAAVVIVDLDKVYAGRFSIAGDVLPDLVGLSFTFQAGMADAQGDVYLSAPMTIAFEAPDQSPAKGVEDPDIQL